MKSNSRPTPLSSASLYLGTIASSAALIITVVDGSVRLGLFSLAVCVPLLSKGDRSSGLVFAQSMRLVHSTATRSSRVVTIRASSSFSATRHLRLARENTARAFVNRPRKAASLPAFRMWRFVVKQDRSPMRCAIRYKVRGATRDLSHADRFHTWNGESCASPATQ
jgi:hypothetical protein